VVRTTRTLRRSRRVAPVAAAGLLFALVPAGAAAADARGTDDVCPAPNGSSEDRFDDLEGAQIHADNIECVAQYAIAQGVAEREYRPLADVNRGQMATFITNLIETATGEELEEPPEDEFDDIDGATHQDEINKLAFNNVVLGTGDGQYDPADPVRRDAMATFVANAIDYAHNGVVDGERPPESGSDPAFGDVSAGNAHVENINRLAAQDIVTGTGEGNYSPTLAVFRAQMATFVMQGADYLDGIAHWLPTFDAESATFEVTMSWLNEVSDDGVFGQGDEPATGEADVTLTTEPDGLGTVQVDFSAQDLSSAPTMVGETGPLHVHEGELAENGPIVLSFVDTPNDVTWSEEDGTASLATTAPLDNAAILDILDEPEGFYVNYHTEDHPDPGAIRGQLPDGGQDQIELDTTS
jgi:hypothetical protein